MKSGFPHTAPDTWQQLAVCPKTGFFDGQLVWAWDGYYKYSRTLRFYDSKNSTTFNETHGGRCGASVDNYEAYEGEYPEWALEAFNKLDLEGK